MRNPKHYLQAVALAALLALGGLTAVALAHFGGSTITCGGVALSYSSFPSTGSNNITETITSNGATIYSSHFIFSGSSASHTIAVSLTGSQTVVAHAFWNGNGVTGSYDSGQIHLTCSSTTSTTTTGTTVTTTVPTTTIITTTTTVPTKTVTVTVPAVTVTSPTQTVTVTQTTPAPPASTVTTTLPAVTTVKTVTPKPRVVVRTKWVTIHHVSTVTVTRTVPNKNCKPHHSVSPEHACRSKGGIWNGHGCGFAGTG